MLKPCLWNEMSSNSSSHRQRKPQFKQFMSIRYHFVQLPLHPFRSTALIKARQLWYCAAVNELFIQLFALLRQRLHAGHWPAARSFALHRKQLRSGCFWLPSYVQGAALSGLHPHSGGIPVTPTLMEFAQEEPVPATAAKKELSSMHSLLPMSAHSLLPLLQTDERCVTDVC